MKKLMKRLHQLQSHKITRDQLLLKLGAAKKEAGRVYGLVEIKLPKKDQKVTEETFSFSLHREKLRKVRRREGRYLMRSNVADKTPASLWEYYIQLTEVDCASMVIMGLLMMEPTECSFGIKPSATPCRARSVSVNIPTISRSIVTTREPIFLSRMIWAAA